MKKILIAVGNSEVGEMTRESLIRHFGVPPECIRLTDNEEITLKILREEPFHTLLVSTTLSVGDGFHLIQEAKGLPVPPLIILISGYTRESVQETLTQLGITGIFLLPLPFKKEDLEKALCDTHFLPLYC